MPLFYLFYNTLLDIKHIVKMEEKAQNQNMILDLNKYKNENNI